MKILAQDLGKYKTVACEYEAENGRHRFVTVLTTPKALHDLIVDREPQRVVIEICSIRIADNSLDVDTAANRGHFDTRFSCETKASIDCIALLINGRPNG